MNGLPASDRDCPHVVLIDDNPNHLRLMEETIQDPAVYEVLGGRPEVLSYTDPGLALASLPPHGMIITLCDFQMPLGTGLDWLPDLLKSDRGPVILLSAYPTDTMVAQAFRAGATDFFDKADVMAQPAYLAESLVSALRRDGLRQSRNELQRQLKVSNAELKTRNDRLAALTETAHRFVDDVAHEFRTPLTVVREFASLIDDGLAGPVTDDQQQMLRHIDHAVSDLSRLVDDFLDTSKLKSRTLRINRQAVPLSSVIEPACEQVQFKAEQRGVDIAVEGLQDNIMVFMDVEKARRALINLLTNAIKYSPENGMIRLKVQRRETCVTLDVIDQGPGLNQEQLDTIHHRFGQAHSAQQPHIDGFGLGLNIAHDLAWLNLGNVTVVSEPGQGSTFGLTLPLADPTCVLTHYAQQRVEADPWHQVTTLVLCHDSCDAATLQDFASVNSGGEDLALPLNDQELLLLAPHDHPSAWKERLTQAWIKHADTMGESPQVQSGLKIEVRLASPAQLFAQQINDILARPSLLRESRHAA